MLKAAVVLVFTGNERTIHATPLMSVAFLAFVRTVRNLGHGFTRSMKFTHIHTEFTLTRTAFTHIHDTCTQNSRNTCHTHTEFAHIHTEFA